MISAIHHAPARVWGSSALACFFALVGVFDGADEVESNAEASFDGAGWGADPVTGEPVAGESDSGICDPVSDETGIFSGPLGDGSDDLGDIT
ncbi:hypothetical protein GCM10011410_11610 [Hoyosella rhizosphaerae]|uniref:Uncharacterized protein n=1 Tax=Hoyosella rhizosphaerae TaxID=1755582 RepID=A0A916U4W7_9ACTN|nr:hypothetical protein GCM10011410_11610 [Hoyosella rhizosphaerae]